jgi:hypothetical protein
MAKRIDDTSSTASASLRRLVFNSIPVVRVVLMLDKFLCCGEYQQKGQPAHAAALFSDTGGRPLTARHLKTRSAYFKPAM